MAKKTEILINHSLFRRIATDAAAGTRENGGIIVGKASKSLIHCMDMVMLSLRHSTRDELDYTNADFQRACAVARATYKPLKVIGGWHSHPYTTKDGKPVESEISDEDKSTIPEGGIELIAIVSPAPKRRSRTESPMETVVGNWLVKVEPWVKRLGRTTKCKAILW